jgi:hypothetical protein
MRVFEGSQIFSLHQVEMRPEAKIRQPSRQIAPK